MENKKRWIFLAICLIGVIGLGIITIFGDISSFDNKGYDILIAWQSDIITVYFKLMTLMADPITLIILCTLSLGTLLTKKKYSIYLIGLMIISVMINKALKYLIGRPRPEGINLITETGYSFPSGHAMGAVSFYGFIIFLISNSKLSKKLKVIINSILVFLIINICISRVYLGVHYVSDVICGVLISLSLLLVLTYYIKKYGRIII